MPQCSYTAPDLTSFCQLDDLGLTVVGPHLTGERAVLLCRPVEPDDWCHRCGCQGSPRDSVVCELAHVAFGWRPTILRVRLRRHRCTGCGHVWRQDLIRAASPRSCLSGGALRWALEAPVVNHLSMTRIAAALDVAWNTANTAVLAEGQRLLIDQPSRLDGFTGFKTTTTEELPAAAEVMDPFHVIRLAGDALDVSRRRVQVSLHGSRGRKHHPLHQNRRTLHAGADLLTDKQQGRLDALFADDRHVEFEATWGVYQTMIAAYRTRSRTEGKKVMTRLIDAIGTAVAISLVEVATLGRTLTKRRDDVLAFFDHIGSSNGPTEAIHGRLEHLRGTALGFRTLTHYIARSLLEAGGFRPDPHPGL
ncbi:MAG: transposase [Luteococcus japonicus]